LSRGSKKLPKAKSPRGCIDNPCPLAFGVFQQPLEESDRHLCRPVVKEELTIYHQSTRSRPILHGKGIDKLLVICYNLTRTQAEAKMRPPQISTSVSPETRKQADELIERFGYSLRDVLTIAIEKLYTEKTQEVAMARYGNCTECGKALSKDEGYYVCAKCGKPLCNKCAAISTVCSKCANK
jgi:NADH pyrophosphatase NudC (nudix superfamily)